MWTAICKVPKNARRPERAIMYLISSMGLSAEPAVLMRIACRYIGGPQLLHLNAGEQHVVPSVRYLSEKAATFVQQALEVHEKFNLAQPLA